MAYIGKTPVIGNFQVCDAITVVDAQAAYTMQVATVDVSPESANHMIVSLNGVIQKPTDAYTVSGSTITFASNLVTGDVIDFIQILGNVLDLGVPSDATVSTAKIVDDAVTLAKMASGTDGNIISYDASGNPVAVATGSAGQVLTSAGAGAPPTFAAAGGITEADQWRLTTDFTTSGVTISSGWERDDTNGSTYIGTGMTESSGIFTFPSTGKYLIIWTPSFLIAQNNTQIQSGIETTTDNSSYNSRAYTFGGGNSTALTSYGAGAAQILFDVTSTSTHKIRFNTGNLNSGSAIRGNTTYNFSEASFIRLGDT
jgi:hypothetical protein